MKLTTIIRFITSIRAILEAVTFQLIGDTGKVWPMEGSNQVILINDQSFKLYNLYNTIHQA